MTEKETQQSVGVVSDLNNELCGWKPMHTAPKDGTEILAWREDCGVITVKHGCIADIFDEQAMEGLDDDAIFSDDWWCADFNGVFRLEGNEVPTLWMPKPTPPQDA